VDEESVNRWGERLKQLLQSMPLDYRQASADANQLSRLFHSELAQALTPRLNAYLANIPKSSLAEGRALATFCNFELAKLHLAIRCPKTGKEATLFADARSTDRDAPRFRLHLRGANQTRTQTSVEMPTLELMEDTASSNVSLRLGRGL